MQPTIIKIKFTPKIRPIEKDNTKYWLEIVPDVSDIQNLDTIEWKNDNKHIEYNVPVTYKVILKRGIDKNTIEKPEKIYYSCIDLRFLSTSSTMACGDVTEVISDNNILRRAKESTSTIATVYRNENNIKEDVCLEEQYIDDTAKELDIACVNQLHSKEDDVIDTGGNDMEILPDLHTVAVIEDKQLVKQMHIECNLSKETVTEDVKNNKEKKRKLTITSICTLNTIDNPIYGESKKNTKICVKNKTRNKIDYKISKKMESFAIHRPIYSDNNYPKAPYERVLPELRVANFMMTVHNEIMPLKILLNEIYGKCASLGLLWNPNVVTTGCPEPHLNNTDKITDNLVNYNKPKPKSNRVVYSIVFEE